MLETWEIALGMNTDEGASERLKHLVSSITPRSVFFVYATNYSVEVPLEITYRP